MAFYGMGTKILIDNLANNVGEIKQVWLADDATGAGNLPQLLRWWNNIITEGQKIGYYVNESKSWLILKDEKELDNAKRMFANTSIILQQRENVISVQHLEIKLSKTSTLKRK